MQNRIRSLSRVLTLGIAEGHALIYSGLDGFVHWLVSRTVDFAIERESEREINMKKKKEKKEEKKEDLLSFNNWLHFLLYASLLLNIFIYNNTYPFTPVDVFNVRDKPQPSSWPEHRTIGEVGYLVSQIYALIYYKIHLLERRACLHLKHPLWQL